MPLLEYLQNHEATIRLICFAGLLALCLGAETRWPRRSASGGGRRGTNLLLVGLNTLFLRLGFPVLAVGAAAWGTGQGWGLLAWLDGPLWLEVLLAVVLLDLIIYGQHRLMHAVPWLWRLHRVHHSDLAFDVTTGVRFHPLEIAVSMIIKMAAVILLGAAAEAVILFEVLLSASSLFEHANLRLPAGLDRALRRVIVTPDMHRVHHSPHREETDSNFGFNLSVWDRLFATYQAQPREGHEAMQIGLSAFRDKQQQGLLALLLQPFRAQ